MSISASRLTCTVSESITLNGQQFGNTIQTTHANISEVRQFVTTIPTSEKLLYKTAASIPTDGSATALELDHDLVQYVRITNADFGNSLNVLLENEDGDEFMYKVNPQTSFLLGTHAECMEGTTGGADVTIGTYDATSAITNVSASANTASVDIEVFIAIGT